MEEAVVNEIVDYLETRDEVSIRKMALDLSGRTAYGRDNLDERYPAATITNTVKALEDEGVVERYDGGLRQSPKYGLADGLDEATVEDIEYDDAGAGEC